MRGADRGQKAGLRWFLLNIGPGSSGSGVVTISCCLIEFPDIGRFGVPTFATHFSDLAATW